MYKILFISLLLCTACAESKKTAHTVTPAPTESPATLSDSALIEARKENEGVSAQPFRLVVSFYSKGSGADAKAIDMFDSFVSGYESWSNKKLDYLKTPWGKEGEVDYCMTLGNLDTQGQKDFVMQVQEILLNSQLVHITENTPCKHMK